MRPPSSKSPLLAAGASAALVLFTLPVPAWAEWSVDGRGILFWTDDVGIFSATRRLSRNDDPTQPALDTELTGQGSDMVFEPGLIIRKRFGNRLGDTALSLRGQGFVYAVNPEFSHGTLRLDALHAFTPKTRLLLRYYYAPDLLLGENEDRHTTPATEADEILTSNIFVARLDRTLTSTLEVRLLGRYGIREYNDAFEQRDTTFWTIGPHLEWRLVPRVKLGLGFHYERGLADGREQPQVRDDVSYINYYGTGDLEIEVTESLSLELSFHYERNDWTSNIVGDPRQGAQETIVQGDVVLFYRLTNTITAFTGFQRSHRQESFEPEGVENTNVGVGISATF